jgi:choline trimethylamine-lyase
MSLVSKSSDSPESKNSRSSNIDWTQPGIAESLRAVPDTKRVISLRTRVRASMDMPPVPWDCPKRIPVEQLGEPLVVRKALAQALKLSEMRTDLWRGQLFAGSMTLEEPKLHLEHGFPDYVTDEERERAAADGLGIGSVFGHIVPDYPRLIELGLDGIRRNAVAAKDGASTDEIDFLDAVCVAIDGVTAYASRLAEDCDAEADRTDDVDRVEELRLMAQNLRQVPAGAAQTFCQALQSVWLLHMIFHSSMNGNALGRLDQYAWPLLEADLAAGRLTMESALELVSAFSLKFNERAKTTDEQSTNARSDDQATPVERTRHYTSSQLGTDRDRLDATNHWLQNIIVGGLTPEGDDGTNPLSYLILEAYRRNEMTNPLVTTRVHRDSPQELLDASCEVMKSGGGMPAIFNDGVLVPALEKIGIPTPDARDYTNDGCWEVLIPGRTDFRFQRLSVMLCLEWALNRGVARFDGSQQGPDPGEPREFATFEDVWQAFEVQLGVMVERVVRGVIERVDDRAGIAPVPLLSALTDGAIEQRRDLTAGGAKFRTYGMLAEGASHAIDSLSAIKRIVFDEGKVTIRELIDAINDDYEGHDSVRRLMHTAPSYGCDEPAADEIGQRLIGAFCNAVELCAAENDSEVKFPCGVGTFSWYIGIGQGLGASPDGRQAGQPVASNFSPALGRDMMGIPAAIASYSKMSHDRLAAGGPLDVRLSRKLVEGYEGTQRMSGLVRGLVDLGGAMLTITVADTEELRAAQQSPEEYRSLRVRMGGWSAYFTMLSREQQDHHIRRQETS